MTLLHRVLLTALSMRTAIQALDGSQVLWYNSPATDFNSALAVGNGRLGGMVWGTGTELIKLNEDSVWSGPWIDRLNPEARDAFPKVREMLVEGDLSGAGDLTLGSMSGNPISPRMYQPLADLSVDLGHGDEMWEDYMRVLDTINGHSVSNYTYSGQDFSREVVASYPDGVIVVRVMSSGTFDATISLNRSQGVHEQTASTDSGTLITMRGGSSSSPGGLDFTAQVRIASDGEPKASNDGKSITVTSATKVDIFVNAETSYRYDDQTSYESELTSKLDKSLTTGYDKVRENAISDHSNLAKRVELDLGSSGDQGQKPTDERLSAFANSPDADPELMTLLFNMGRHLLIASSREGDKALAANLQGIWNQDFDPAWGSKYTININIEMNYWPAGPTNLMETNDPLFDTLDTARQRGQAMARDIYGCSGFVLHHNIDCWGDAAPTDNGTAYTLWPMGGVWLSWHLMEHYRFTGDVEFLKDRVWPVITDAAAFYYDYLFVHDGHYFTGPSLSPENTYIIPEGDNGAGDSTGLDIAPAMDNELLWQLFTDIIEAGEILGSTASEAVEKAKSFRSQLRVPQVGSYGQIVEWHEEFDQAELGHRHLSPLVGLFPGRQMTPLIDTDLANASRVLLDERIADGGGSTGWSRAWTINCYARLFDGDKAWMHAQKLLQGYILPNMFNSNDGPPFQIDGNFGFVSGIAEMLVQSHADGVVHLVPAIPADGAAGAAGSVRGLLARGGFVVDVSWAGGRFEKATVVSRLGRKLEVRVGNGEEFVVNGGKYDGALDTSEGDEFEITLV